MQKPVVRPLRLKRMNTHALETCLVEKKPEEMPENQQSKARKQASSSQSVLVLPTDEPIAEMPLGETEAQGLLQRTPRSYLLNQLYGLWFFLSLFILSIILTRKLPNEQYGVFAVASVAFNTIAYIVALGLEDATTTYVPKIFAEHGKAAAALLLRRLLVVRIGILLLSMLILLFGMPLLATLFVVLPFPGAADTAKGLRDPALLGHITPIAFYVLGNGISSLFTSVCASLMKMRPVFIIGSITQVVLLGMAFLLLQLGWGVDGILWLQGTLSLLGSIAFGLWLIPLLSTKGATYRQPLRPVLQLGINAWLTQLVTGALLKQTAVILLGYFAVSIVQIGYFNLSFQLGHSASLLLVTGFGGVAGSALAASFVGKNSDRLARTWQVLIKIETLLAAPILIFCLFNAQVIAHTIYGSNYDPVGPLLAIFLFFNLLVRALGTTISQYVLYVLGKAHLAVLSQWSGLAALIVLGILFIPSMGPAGALIADGLSQLITGSLMLLFLWRPLPRKYPLGFTLRLVIGLLLAALPGILLLLWHPAGYMLEEIPGGNFLLLGVLGVIFLVLCVVVLRFIKPLNAEDMEMIGVLNKKMARYLGWFARDTK